MKEDFSMIAFGRTATTITPSGRVFTIREQNGNDDDLLSNPATARDFSNVDNFLCAIIINEIVNDEKLPVTVDTVKGLLVNDRYYLLIFSRIHSLGNIMKFTYDFGDDKINGGKFDYEEDLQPYLHDYSKPFPEIGEEGYFKYKIPPYPLNANKGEFTIITKSGKNLKFGLLSGLGEKYILGLELSERTKNHELKARNLKYLNDSNEWVKVENFAMFSKMDMVDIHKVVSEVDPTYRFISEIEHPKTKEIIYFNIITSDSFFYPVEV